MSKVVDCVHTAAGHLNSRRLVICCDGTWNDSNHGDDPDTNVARLAAAVQQKSCCGKPQIVFYHAGVGTEFSWVAKRLGGLLGLGVAQDIVEAYRFVCDNYEPGDEIILVGFSRGAFTARSVADMICNIGFLNRAGLDSLPQIFHDYETWQDWGSSSSSSSSSQDKLDHQKYLTGFTIENFDRVQRTKIAWERQEMANLTQGKEAGTTSQVRRQAVTFEEARQARMQGMSEAEKKDFTPERFAELLASEMSQTLLERKEGLWKAIRQAKSREEISKLYRAELDYHRLVQVDKKRDVDHPGKFTYEPLEGKVKAVAVWDTVGSLGVPNTPWGKRSRSNHEIRFTSLQMHRNVDHAFHAMGLDEYRTAFSPTMWEQGDDNDNTRLRQVWFPGNHGDVGGGWEDEQAYNISLAWMADQLTSVGVEFDRSEMQRIFYDVHSKVLPRNWAMGKIHNPPLTTSLLDKVWSGAQFKEPTPRTPGLYKRDKPQHTPVSLVRPSTWFTGAHPAAEPLGRTNEFVHPCVRVRHVHGGKGPDDEATYRCRALTQNGYRLVDAATLEKQKKPQPVSPQSNMTPGQEEEGQQHRRDTKPSDVYDTVGGRVAPLWEDPNAAALDGLGGEMRAVRVQQPIEKVDVLDVPAPKTRWAWVRDARGSDPQVVLPEEEIGVWERLYMKVQEELVDWKPIYVARLSQAAREEREQKNAAGKAWDWITSGKVAVDDVGARIYQDLAVWQRGLTG